MSPPTAERLIGVDRLKVPLPLALGRYEYLTDEELYDHITDINAEATRRAGAKDRADRGA